MTCLEAEAGGCLLQIRPIKLMKINFPTFLLLADSPPQESRLLPEQIACSTAKAQPCSDLEMNQMNTFIKNDRSAHVSLIGSPGNSISLAAESVLLEKQWP